MQVPGSSSVFDFHTAMETGLHIYGLSATVLAAAKNAPPGVITGNLVAYKAGAYVSHIFYGNDGRVWSEGYNGSTWGDWDLKTSNNDFDVTYAALGTGTILKSGHVVAVDIINARSDANALLDIAIPSGYRKAGWQIPCTYYSGSAGTAGKLVIESGGGITLYSAAAAKVPNATMIVATSAWII